MVIGQTNSINFAEWLRGEIQQSETLDTTAINPASVAYVHARRRALLEVSLAWDKAEENPKIGRES